MTRANLYLGRTQAMLNAARSDVLDALGYLADCEEQISKLDDADEARADALASIADIKSDMHAHLDDIQDAEQYTKETSIERRREEAAATPSRAM